MTDEKQRVVVGVSGASGIVYAARALEMLRSVKVETHLVVSRSAELMRAYESALSRTDLEALADVVYSINDVGAPIAVGLVQDARHDRRALLDAQLSRRSPAG